MRFLLVASVGLAALSLLGPHEPTYDPWAWLIWGREIVHWNLSTTAGPSWKPLPVLFTTAFAPLGGRAEVLLWLVVARAGALLAIGLALRLARRLAGWPAGRRASWPRPVSRSRTRSRRCRRSAARGSRSV